MWTAADYAIVLSLLGLAAVIVLGLTMDRPRGPRR